MIFHLKVNMAFPSRRTEYNRNQYPSFVNSVIINNWWYFLQQNFTHTSSSDCSKGQGHIHGTWWWRPPYRWSSKGVHLPLSPPVEFKSHDSAFAYYEFYLALWGWPHGKFWYSCRSIAPVLKKIQIYDLGATVTVPCIQKVVI